MSASRWAESCTPRRGRCGGARDRQKSDLGRRDQVVTNGLDTGTPRAESDGGTVRPCGVTVRRACRAWDVPRSHCSGCLTVGIVVWLSSKALPDGDNRPKLRGATGTTVKAGTPPTST